MNYKRLTVAQACTVAGCGRTKFYTKVKTGTYPAARKDGRASYWLEHELLEALRSEDQALKQPKEKKQ